MVRANQYIVFEIDGLLGLWEEGLKTSGDDTEFDIV